MRRTLHVLDFSRQARRDSWFLAGIPPRYSGTGHSCMQMRAPCSPCRSTWSGWRSLDHPHRFSPVMDKTAGAADFALARDGTLCMSQTPLPPRDGL